MSLIRFKICLWALLIMLGWQRTNAQLMVTSAQGTLPDALVKNVLIGQGVTVSNVKFNNLTTAIPHGAIGTFQTGANATNLGLTSGILLTSGTATIAVGPNNSGSDGSAITPNISDPQLAALIPGYTVNDVAKLEFDFIPESDSVEFRWIFGSEEYPEWVNSSFNDVFGFFISGGFDPTNYWLPYNNKNIALIPSPPAPVNTPVTIDNVNAGSYPQFYVNNAGGTWVEYDGFTTVLTAKAYVVPCVPYHIKIAVADAGDQAYDSGVFLEEGSFNSGGISVSTSYVSPGGTTSIFNNAIEGCNDAMITFKFPAPLADSLVINIASFGGNAINGLDYAWIPNAVVIPAGSDSGSIVIHPLPDGLTEGTETVMLVVPTGVCSQITNEYDTHYIDIIDYAPLLVGAISDTTIQCGDTVDLTATQTGGLGPYSWYWSNDTLGVSINQSVSIIPVLTDTYTVELTDVCDNTVYDSVKVTVIGIVADAGTDTAVCIGSTVDLSVSGGTAWAWSNGATTANIQVSPLMTTSYFVTAYNYLCSGLDTVTVTINPLPLVSINTSADSICPGETSTFSASGAASWQWVSSPADPGLSPQAGQAAVNLSPGTTTMYTVFGTDTNGCVNSQASSLLLKPVPTADFSVLDTLICEGEPTTVVYSGSSSTHASFEWNFDGGQFNGSGPGPYIVSWDTVGVQYVHLTVIDDGCVSAEHIRDVSVQPHPSVGYYALNNEGCPPLTVSFRDTSSNVNPGAVYHWTFGNGGTAFQPNPDFTYTESGLYDISLSITNPNGCQTKLIYPGLVHAYEVPQAVLRHSPGYGTEFNPLIKFFDRSEGNVVQWTWSTGDGQIYYVPDFHHQYADTGRFEVSLIVMNDLGCSDTMRAWVEIRPDYTFYVPNAFTPDGDNLNDVFRISGLNVNGFSLNIFDRWGGLVFESHDIDMGWDGTIRGSQAPVGLYVVVVYFTDVNGLRRSHYGHVSLVR
ncbi:MAG TPA: choice-of-anchor L domain-containing protein [Bacteroidales bacterium]|nr:choice-of-anchor L domain-containing protein [Bacteroidales bacterium]